MPKIKHLIERLQGYDPESFAATHLWTWEDVTEYLTQNQDKFPLFMTCTPEQRVKIWTNTLYDMEKYLDSEYGMTWESLKHHTAANYNEVFKNEIKEQNDKEQNDSN